MRQLESNQKFLLGLSFERSGLAMTESHYIDSNQAQKICTTLLNNMEQGEGLEHQYFKTGQQAFDSKTFMEDKSQIQKAENMLGLDWKRERYHNLVRLGGDAIACGLHEYSKATILGGLLVFAQDKKS
jgi:hypothetical protein